MIGLICAFFIGKYFYKLAKDYQQKKLVYCVLGVFVFYFGSIVLGNLILFYFTGISNYNFKLFSFFGTGFITMPFGIGFACLIHYLLENRWKKSVVIVKDEINDIGKNIN
ncbi:hypothetical protein [Thalassobellus citreus]|uniref:hypothetical protein n=1 Tax=Thalassobellus citreus TaxID=3367752 RepID=UPI0037AE4AA6